MVFILPFEAMVVFSALWITGFALTSLDTATRLGRFARQELMSPLKDKAPSAYKVLADRWIASIIIVAQLVPLAWRAAWKILWPVFC